MQNRQFTPATNEVVNIQLTVPKLPSKIVHVTDNNDDLNGSGKKRAGKHRKKSKFSKSVCIYLNSSSLL